MHQDIGKLSYTRLGQKQTRQVQEIELKHKKKIAGRDLLKCVIVQLYVWSCIGERHESHICEQQFPLLQSHLQFASTESQAQREPRAAGCCRRIRRALRCYNLLTPFLYPSVSSATAQRYPRWGFFFRNFCSLTWKFEMKNTQSNIDSENNYTNLIPNMYPKKI